MEEFKDWFIELSRFSALAGCLFYLFFKKSQTQISGILFFLLFASLLADNLNFFFIRMIYPNGYYVGNAWHIINYVLSIFLFLKLLEKYRVTLWVLLATFLTGTLISFGFIFDFSESNIFIRTFANTSFIFLSLLVFLQLLKNPSGRLRNHPVFWIATSYFIYNSILLLHGLFNNYLIFDLKISAEAYRVIAIINLFANITKNFILFYALALIDKGYPDKLKPSST